MTSPLLANPISLPLLGGVPIPRSAVDATRAPNWMKRIGWSDWPNWKAAALAEVRAGVERGGPGLCGSRAGQEAAAVVPGRPAGR